MMDKLEDSLDEIVSLWGKEQKYAEEKGWRETVRHELIQDVIDCGNPLKALEFYPISETAHTFRVIGRNFTYEQSREETFPYVSTLLPRGQWIYIGKLSDTLSREAFISQLVECVYFPKRGWKYRNYQKAGMSLPGGALQATWFKKVEDSFNSLLCVKVVDSTRQQAILKRIK